VQLPLEPAHTFRTGSRQRYVVPFALRIARPRALGPSREQEYIILGPISTRARGKARAGGTGTWGIYRNPGQAALSQHPGGGAALPFRRRTPRSFDPPRFRDRMVLPYSLTAVRVAHGGGLGLLNGGVSLPRSPLRGQAREASPRPWRKFPPDPIPKANASESLAGGCGTVPISKIHMDLHRHFGSHRGIGAARPLDAPTIIPLCYRQKGKRMPSERWLLLRVGAALQVALPISQVRRVLHRQERDFEDFASQATDLAARLGVTPGASLPGVLILLNNGRCWLAGEALLADGRRGLRYLSLPGDLFRGRPWCRGVLSDGERWIYVMNEEGIGERNE